MIAIGLGGNVGGEAAVVARFARVAEALAAWGPVRRSSVFRTAPIGPAQPDFLNAALVVAADPDPTPRELAATLQELERLSGRDRAREERWGPRPLDLDVLLWDERCDCYEIDGGWLEVPHPRLHLRRFALEPLAELVGEDRVLPGVGRRVGDLLSEARGQVLIATDWAIR